MSADAYFSPEPVRIVPPAAKWLGAAGLLPFLAGAVASLPVAGALRPFGEPLLLAYGAIILSFMGGVHWGAAMLRDDASLPALGAASCLRCSRCPPPPAAARWGSRSSRSGFAGCSSMTRARFAPGACRSGIQNYGVP